MHLAIIDSVLWWSSVAGQLLLLWVLISRRLYRTFPVFTAWVVLSAATDPLYYLVLHTGSQIAFPKFFFVMSFPDALLQLGVLFEMVSNILRPMKRSLPRGALIVIAVLTLLGAGIAFVLADHLSMATLASQRRQVILDEAFSILFLTIFLGMAAFAQVLGLGWKNHVLQLATGFGFYSACALIIAQVHGRLTASPSYLLEYTMLSQAQVISYLGTMAFWCYSFTRQEAARKEFSQPMAQFVLSISRDTARLREEIVKKRA